MYDKTKETVLRTVLIEEWKTEYEILQKHLNGKARLMTIEEYEKKKGANDRETLVLAATARGICWGKDHQTAILGDALTGKVEELSDVRLLIEGFEETDYEFFMRQYKRHHGFPWDIMETKRCVLREQTLEDLEDLYRIYSGEGITEYMEPLYEKYEDEEAYLEKYIEIIYGFYELGLWLIIDKESGEAIGRAGLTPEEFDDGNQLELGYVIDRAYQRKGYATEVCKAILQYGEECYPGEKINCLIEPENEASIRLVKKLGFHYLKTVSKGSKNLDRYCI